MVENLSINGILKYTAILEINIKYFLFQLLTFSENMVFL